MRLAFAFVLLVSACYGQTTFASSDAALKQIGPWSTRTTSGQSAIFTQGTYAQYETTATCSKIELQVYQNGENLAVTIDGSTNNTGVLSGNVWGFITLYDGSDASHTVKVRTANATLWDAHATSTLRCTGAAPAVAAPTGYGDFIGPIDSSQYVALDGAPELAGPCCGSVYSTTAFYAKSDSGPRIYANTTHLWWWGYGAASAGTMSVVRDDGTVMCDVEPTGTATFDLYGCSGLSGTHSYTIRGTGSSGVDTMRVWGVMASGSFLPVGPARPVLGQYGDSIVDQDNSGFTSTLSGSGYKETMLTKLESVRRGFPSQRIVGTLSTPTTNMDTICDLTTLPKVLIVAGGANDINQGETQASIQASTETILNYFNGCLTAGAVMLVRDVLPTIRVGTPSRATVNAGIAAAVAAYMATHPTVPAYYFNTENWIIPSPNGVDTTDGTHPDDDGYWKIARQESPAISAAANRVSFAWW